MALNLTPSAITADRQAREMTIQWSDGHTSKYSFTLLRNACPCAECRGGHDKMSSEPDQAVFNLPEKDTPATMMKSVEAVGTYAMIVKDSRVNYVRQHTRLLRRDC